MPIGGGRLVLFRTDLGGLPTLSIDASGSGTRYLSMSNANFGDGYDNQKVGCSFWIKYNSAATNQSSVFKGARDSGTSEINCDTLATGAVRFELNFSSSGSKVIDSSEVDDTNWHHVYCVCDTTLATATDRMRVYIDGVQDVNATGITISDTISSAAGAPQLAVACGDTANDLDALVYQLAFFESNVPAIGDLYAAGSPKSVENLSGLYSYLDIGGADVTNDFVLATDWTNNNTVTTSATIP